MYLQHLDSQLDLYAETISFALPTYERASFATMGSLSSITVHDVTIESFEVIDLRFPTSLDGVGSDAMHVGTNGSHPYIRLKTNHGNFVGEGIVSAASPLCTHRRSLTKASTGIQQRPRERTHLHGSRHFRAPCCG